MEIILKKILQKLIILGFALVLSLIAILSLTIADFSIGRTAQFFLEALCMVLAGIVFFFFSVKRNQYRRIKNKVLYAADIFENQKIIIVGKIPDESQFRFFVFDCDDAENADNHLQLQFDKYALDANGITLRNGKYLRKGGRFYRIEN
jgi:hypothetical protein